MLTIVYIMWYLLIFTAIVFFISGLDEVFFDVYFWIFYWFRCWKYKNSELLTYEKLTAIPEQHIAILVPCWHEEDVIEQMLNYNVKTIDYNNYDLFIGVYCNDPKTIEAVQNAAKLSSKVHCVIGKNPGPTTKGANLNVIYQFILNYEKHKNFKYNIFVLHDSEDFIHALSFKVYNYLIPSKQMVQLPVLPFEVNLLNFTHWVYADEFAENHTKTMIVREAIGGLVPSAGVGTGFSREIIKSLAHDNDGKPFATDTLTEDYDTALRIRLKNLREIFVVRTIRHTIQKKKWRFFGKIVAKNVKQWVATRAYFPTSYRKSVTQKARWITGISMQQWRNTGWPGNFTTRYTLIHDRKTLITHFINIIGYIVFGFWLIYSIIVMYHPTLPTLQEFLDQSHWVWYLIIGCTLIMIETLCQRMIAVYKIYGLIPALLSLPRVFYGNIINMHALLIAYSQFIFSIKQKSRSGKWAKTEHTFGNLAKFNIDREKLGDILLRYNYLTKNQLDKLISQQMLSGKKLGELLIKEKYLNAQQLMQLLAEQYQMPLINIDKYSILEHSNMNLISDKKYRWLISNHIYPIAIHANEITVVIPDPSNKLFLEKITSKIYPYQPKFVLSSVNIQ